jgi:CDP-diacylglycerol--serine O-phosphatidyltransferase
MSFVWSVDKFGLAGSDFCFITPVIAIVTGLLMVSRFRYFSFKSLPLGERQRVPFAWMVGAVLLLALLILDTPRVLFVGFTIYLLSGPVLTVWGLTTHRRRARRNPA